LGQRLQKLSLKLTVAVAEKQQDVQENVEKISVV
jgi:hypothetical protein